MDSDPNPRSNPAVRDDVFADALDIPLNQREAFVLSRCGNRQDLAQSVLALLDRFDRLGSFLQEPAAAPSRTVTKISPGTVLSGRFSLLRMLGQGGMGVVWLADDLELGEPVALKMIRGIWLDDPAVLARFREEIRLARKVAHRNVCRIHELFNDTSGDHTRVFFTMEYVEGQSMAALLRAGWRRNPAQIIPLIRDLAAGLDAAHDAGIVHRDLKPANIVLSEIPGGGYRPVIMDFGLAHGLTARDTSITQAGQILGSPDYMAPEQFMGGRITPATDVFSLAAIVHEILTGARPWPDENLIQAAIRRVGDPPGNVQCGAFAPPAWNNLLQAALSRNPAERPQRASHLVDQLAGASQARARPQLPSRRTLLLGTSAVIGVSCFAGFYRYYNRDPNIAGPPDLFLAPIDAFAGFGEAKTLDFLMETQLRQSAHVQVPSPGVVADAWKKLHNGQALALPASLQPAEARQLALFAGTRYVLFTSISRTGDDYKLAVKLEPLGPNPDHAATGPTKEFIAQDQNSLLRVTRDAAIWVRGALGEIPSDIAARAFSSEDLASGNWRAIREYLQAQEAWSGDIHGARADEAIRRLRAALDLDPGFALAAGRLGDLLVAIGQEDEGLRWQQTAIDLLDRRDLTDRQSLKIRGMFYQDTGQDAKAENLFSLWAIGYPKDGTPLFYKSKSLMRLGRAEESFALRAKAARLEPGNFALALGAAQSLLEAGDLDGASAAAAKLPQHGRTDRLRACIGFSRYDLTEVRRNLDQMRSRDVPFQCESSALSACLSADLGDMSQSEASAREVVRLALGQGLANELFAGKLLLAKVCLLQGRSAEAQRICHEILALNPGLRGTMETGCILARAGALSTAKACLPSTPVPDLPVYQHWEKRLAAEIALVQDRPKDSVGRLSDVPPPELLDDWPEYIVRVSLAARQLDRAKTLISDLLQNPGRYWWTTDTTGPGIFRWSVRQALEHRLVDPVSPELVRLQRMLGA